MRHLIITSVLTINIFLSAFSQTNEQVKSFFFNLPFHETKFELRKQLQSNINLYEFKEMGFVMSASIKSTASHPILTFPSIVEKGLYMPGYYVNYHYDGAKSGLSRTKSIEFEYSVNDLNICLEQYKKSVAYFSKNCNRIADTFTMPNGATTPNPNEKTGEGKEFYPYAGASFAFVSVSYSYKETKTYQPAHYILSLTVYEDPLTVTNEK